MAFVMPAPLNAFGSEPTAFMVNATRQFQPRMVSVINRTSQRVGRPTHDVFAGGQVGRGAPIARISLQASSSHPAQATALQALSLSLTHPTVFLDESRRVVSGLPRGLDGDEQLDGVLLPTPEERAVFGIDDAAFISLIIALIPLVVVTAQVALPPLIEFVQNLFPGLFLPPQQAAPPVVDVAPAPVSTLSLDDPLVVGGGFLLLAFLLMR